VQEAALREGRSPTARDWGEEPSSAWGSVTDSERSTPIRTERGSYLGFYAGVATALRDGAPRPVNPNDSVRVLEILEQARESDR
jgi:hypothetical protein